MKKIECSIILTSNGVKLEDKATADNYELNRTKITGGASHYLRKTKPETRYLSGMFFDKANRYYYGNDANMIRYEVALNPATNEAIITIFDKIPNSVEPPEMPF